MSWLLIRLPSGTLEVELDALAPACPVLGSYPTITEARTARDRQREADEREALRDAGQMELLP